MEHPEYPYTIYHDVEGYRIIDNYEEAAEYLEQAGWSRRPSLAGLSQRLDVIERKVFGKVESASLRLEELGPLDHVGPSQKAHALGLKKVKE